MHKYTWSPYSFVLVLSPVTEAESPNEDWCCQCMYSNIQRNGVLTKWCMSLPFSVQSVSHFPKVSWFSTMDHIFYPEGVWRDVIKMVARWRQIWRSWWSYSMVPLWERYLNSWTTSIFFWPAWHPVQLKERMTATTEWWLAYTEMGG